MKEQEGNIAPTGCYGFVSSFGVLARVRGALQGSVVPGYVGPNLGYDKLNMPRAENTKPMKPML
jgi:hypothetical protein